MAKYDIGIMGFWYGCNYGSILTYFALNSCLKDMGKSVLMIDKPVIIKGDAEYRKTHSRVFAEKEYNISKVYEIYDLNELNDYCDCFITGSDQLWNYFLAKPFAFSLFLDFVQDDKLKIACATSFGHETFDAPVGYKEITGEFLKKFDKISVREKSGERILKEDFAIDGTTIADPIFLCKISEYERILEQSKFKAEPNSYIIAYILDYTEEKKDFLENIQKKYNKKVYIIVDGTPWHFKENKAKYDKSQLSVLDDVSIHEFLYAIKNAKYVVTDSYHGTCVSLIFHKQFLTIGNIKRGLTRFKSLLSEINLLDRMSTSVSDFYKILNTDIDYSTVTKSLNDFSDRSRNWLLNAINIRKNKLNEKTIQNLDPSKCSGCGTCASVCNKKAIEMVKDSNGFYRPIINNALCNDCGLCEKRCPVLHHQSENRLDPKCFAVMASDEIREVSSSGGMFTLAANEIISRGGIVCGAVYDGDFNVMHICSDSDSEIFKMRGSKYYQSKAWDCFLLIKEALRNGKEVLFTGTPCQVAGLKSYLFKQYDNLYTIDLLCHGISSKEIFDKYKKENLGNNTLNSLEFKSKKPWGWHSGINAMFSNGDKYQKIAEQDSYLQAYLYGLSKRESCMYCQGNTLPRQGDLTIGDFWKISLYDKSLNDNLGTSLVLVNNEKGMNLLERIKKQNIKVIKEVPIKFALAGNQIIVHPYKLHKNHNFFFRFLNKVNFNSLYKGLIDNKLYNEFFKNLCKIIPENEHLFYFIGKIVAENYKGRMIATWIKSEQFEKILYSNFGLRVSFYISENKNITGKNNIKHIDELKGLKNKVYIVSLDKIGDDNIYTKLNNYGFIEYKDFIFKIPKAQSISNLNLESGLYIDKLFNSVEGDKGILSRVIFRGFNNHIIIGKNVELSKDLVFDLSDNCIVEIGDNVKLRGKVRFELRGYKGPKTVRLGNNCIFYNNVLFRLFDCADAIIGEGVTSSSDFEAHVTYNKTLVIGNDCMFSYKNEIWAGDGHGIFDVETRKLINIDFENKYNEKNIVSIGSHVWIGKQATILNNSSIGNGSIIGAMSVIKGHFPNNCSIAGNPGKIVRSNIVWSRSGLTNNIESCGLEYINKTDFNYTRTTQGKNVLVVGGTGFLGIKLVQTLLNSGNKVTILSRGIKYENLSLSINRLYANLDNFNDVEKALKGKTFDVIFNIIANNTGRIENLLSVVQCKRYVQLSTIKVYEPFKHLELKEQDFEPYNYKLNIHDNDTDFIEGKRQAEAFIFQRYPHISAVTVRIPYILDDKDELYLFTKNILQGKSINMEEISRCFTFVKRDEVCQFFAWIANKNYIGPINFSSNGFLTIQNILDFIYQKSGKKPNVNKNGDNTLFQLINDKSFFLNLDVINNLGWKTSDFHQWFFILLNKYIKQALIEINKN